MMNIKKIFQSRVGFRHCIVRAGIFWGLLAGCADGAGSAGTSGTDSIEDGDGGAGTDTEGDSQRDSDGAYAHLGVCGVSGETTTGVETVSGYEEHYLIGEEGFGETLCRIRYPLLYIGEPDVPCDGCAVSFAVERGEPDVVVNEENVCSTSELGLDDARMAALVGTQVALGYMAEYVGHANVLMQLDVSTGAWQATAFAAYDETTGILSFDQRDGYCGY